MNLMQRSYLAAERTVGVPGGPRPREMDRRLSAFFRMVLTRVSRAFPFPFFSWDWSASGEVGVDEVPCIAGTAED